MNATSKAYPQFLRNMSCLGYDTNLPPPRFVQTDKNLPFQCHMHYTDPDADLREPITVFGRPRKGLFYNYSDRICYGNQWRLGEYYAELCGAEVHTARWFEICLNTFHGSQDVDLQHVMLGVNRGTCYDYLVFGYTYTLPK